MAIASRSFGFPTNKANTPDPGPAIAFVRPLHSDERFDAKVRPFIHAEPDSVNLVISSVQPFLRHKPLALELVDIDAIIGFGRREVVAATGTDEGVKFE
ncbi:hypothetical protein ASE78_01190 [Sphingomonas sp. Leaf25]|nr:hypothetical protein ASE78_01190 [Sphingomonas sp. Leaf25]